MMMSYLSDIDDRSVLMLLMHNTDNVPTCNWTEQVIRTERTRKGYKHIQYTFFTIVTLSMTNCELMQIMQNALNANQHILKVALDARKLTPVISTFPFKHGHSEGLQFYCLRILLARWKKRPKLRTSQLRFRPNRAVFPKVRNRNQLSLRTLPLPGSRKGRFFPFI